MAKEFKVKEVDVAIQYSSGGWTLDYDGHLGNGSSSKPYPNIKPKKDDGPHFIVFTIENSPPNVTFADNPVWVSAAGKPTGPSTDPQIASPQVKNDGKKLVLFDWNSKEVDLHYVLKFNNARDLDPIIQNGGGGGGQPVPPFQFAYVQVLAAALIFLVIGMWVQKRFKPFG